jgi:hypothetical protein
VYFLKAALNFALSFLRIVTLSSKNVKNFDASIKCVFVKTISLYLVYEDGAYSWLK